MRWRLWLITPSLMLLMTFGVQAAGDLQVDYDFTDYAGTGFALNPSVGQLDSDDIIVTGISDGDLTFGGTATTAIPEPASIIMVRLGLAVLL